MGKRGPPPTPTKILERRGSWRAKTRPGEPESIEEIPRCPQWLRPRARRLWKELVPVLRRMRILSASDRQALARYCTLWDRWLEAETFLANNGQTYEAEVFNSKTGEVYTADYKAYPEVGIAQKLSAELGKMEKEFGLTPSARTRISLEPEKKKDENANKRGFLKIG